MADKRRPRSVLFNLELLRCRSSRWHKTLHVHRRAIDQLTNLWGNDVLPVLALIDGFVQPLALCLIFEPARPDVDAVVLLAAVASGNHHSFRHLEGNDLLLHALEPGLHLARADRVLSEF